MSATTVRIEAADARAGMSADELVSAILGLPAEAHVTAVRVEAGLRGQVRALKLTIERPLTIVDVD